MILWSELAEVIIMVYGGLREKRFLLPFWEKRGFSAKTPPKISAVNLIEAIDTNISSIWLLNHDVLLFNIYVIYLILLHLMFYRLLRFLGL